MSDFVIAMAPPLWLLFLWCAVTGIACIVAEFTFNALNKYPPYAEETLSRILIGCVCGMIVFGSGGIVAGAWLLFVYWAER